MGDIHLSQILAKVLGGVRRLENVACPWSSWKGFSVPIGAWKAGLSTLNWRRERLALAFLSPEKRAEAMWEEQ